MVRWYLFMEKNREMISVITPSRRRRCSAISCSPFYDPHRLRLIQRAQPVRHFYPFRYVTEFFYWTGGNSLDIHSWHRLGMWFIAAFIVGHVYMAIREDIMSDDTVISTMVNGYRSHKFPKGQHDKEAS